MPLTFRQLRDLSAEIDTRDDMIDAAMSAPVPSVTKENVPKNALRRRLMDQMRQRQLKDKEREKEIGLGIPD